MDRTTSGTPDQGEALVRGLEGVDTANVERRHEVLMDFAERQLGLTRDFAEQIHGLAEEEGLETLFALHLVGTGVGVRELEEPEQDMDELASQQAPPEWVSEDGVELDDVALERRLRATFRRFRSHLEASSDGAAAARRFLADPDVDAVRLR